MDTTNPVNECSITDAFVDQLQDELTHTHRLGIDWLRDQLRLKFEARGLTEQQIDTALVLGETSALIDGIFDSSFDGHQRDSMIEQITEWVFNRRELESDTSELIEGVR